METPVDHRQGATKTWMGWSQPNCHAPHTYWMLDLWHDHLAPKVPSSFCGAPQIELLLVVEGCVAPIVVSMALGKGKSKFHVRVGDERLWLGSPLLEAGLNGQGAHEGYIPTSKARHCWGSDEYGVYSLGERRRLWSCLFLGGWGEGR